MTVKIKTFQDINWESLRKNAAQTVPKKRKTASDWDKKAAGFAQRTSNSLYVKRFLSSLQPNKSWSVLDVGCGPGTLALPLSRHVRAISALDYSQAMLDILNREIDKQKKTNITTHRLAWEDDWKKAGIRQHDVALASRSLAVRELRPALEKLNNYAGQLACLTDRVGTGPHDPGVFEAVGRKLESGSDYIYTVNMLYSMNINASVNFIPLEEILTFPSMDEAIANFSWMLEDLDSREEKLLAKYIASMVIGREDEQITLQRRHVPVWAFISWKPQ